MVQKMTQDVFQGKNLGAIVNNGQHVDTESGLHIGLLVQIVQKDLGIFTPF